MNCCRSFTRLTVPQCLSFSVFIWQPVQTKDKYSLVTYSLIGLNCVMCCVIAGVIIRVCEKVQSSGTCVVCGGSASKKYHFTSCKCCNCYGNTNPWSKCTLMHPFPLSSPQCTPMHHLFFILIIAKGLSQKTTVQLQILKIELNWRNEMKKVNMKGSRFCSHSIACSTLSVTNCD